MQVRKIDRKLKACHNPLLDPDSDVFKQLAAAAEQQEQEVRDQKVSINLYQTSGGRPAVLSAVKHSVPVLWRSDDLSSATALLALAICTLNHTVSCWCKVRYLLASEHVFTAQQHRLPVCSGSRKRSKVRQQRQS